MSIKIHLGCGDKYLHGFVHVDLADFEHVDYRCDVRRLPMFGDGSAGLIYACHVLQYFDLLEAVDVLREWRRVLEPGGTLRLAVPDFDALTQVYHWIGGSLATVLGPLYGRMSVGGEAIYHKTTFDLESLSYLLRATGFRGIRRWDWRETEHSEIDDCSQAYWLNGILVSLNMEANKA